MAAHLFYTVPHEVKELRYIGNTPLATFEGPPLEILHQVSWNGRNGRTLRAIGSTRPALPESFCPTHEVKTPLPRRMLRSKKSDFTNTF